MAEINQPIPKVTRADLERIARRDFPSNFEQAMSKLDCHATNGHERFCAAAMKLARGDVKRLDHYLSQDFRDTLANAEYPGYMDQVAGPRQPSEVQRIVDSDWEQYQEWFNK